MQGFVVKTSCTKAAGRNLAGVAPRLKPILQLIIVAKISMTNAREECVNATSVDDWSSLSVKYNQWGDSYSNQFCRPADGSLKKDCCRCMKRRPCRDGGCYENGGKCVDMKKAHIYLNYHGVTHHHGVASRSLLGRSFAPFFTTDNGQVDLSNRIDGDGLCQSEDPKQPSCCQCYQRITNRKSGNFNLTQIC